MKTTKAGSRIDREPETTIWVGAEFKCFNCRGEFKLELTDTVVEIAPSVPGVLSIKTPRCPTIGCGLVNIVDVPLTEGGAS